MDAAAPIREADVSIATLQGVFQAALVPCSVDKDGDLRIEEGGIKCFIRVNTEKKLLTFFSIWGLKSSIFDHKKKLEFTNKLNNEYIIVRFCMPKPDMLWCDYQMLYEGGVLPFQVVNTCKRFMRVCGGIVSDDADNLLA